MARNDIRKGELAEAALTNYKGFFYDNPGQKYQDEVTGAHFEYFDMCLRLKRLRKQITIERSADVSDSKEDPALSKAKLTRNQPRDFKQQAYNTFKAQDRSGKVGPGKGKNSRQLSSNNVGKAGQVGQADSRVKSITKFYLQKKPNGNLHLKKQDKVESIKKYETLRGMYFHERIKIRQKSIAKILDERLKTTKVMQRNHMKKVSAPQVATTVKIPPKRVKSRNKTYKTLTAGQKVQPCLLPTKKADKCAVEKGSSSTMTGSLSSKNENATAAAAEPSTSRANSQKVQLMAEIKKAHVPSLVQCNKEQ